MLLKLVLIFFVTDLALANKICEKLNAHRKEIPQNFMKTFCNRQKSSIPTKGPMRSYYPKHTKSVSIFLI